MLDKTIALILGLWLVWLTIFAEDNDNNATVTIIMKTIFAGAAFLCFYALFSGNTDAIR